MANQNTNSLFLRACRREQTERTPVWLMRQAGRYMPEYREIRRKVSFLELCKTPDLAAEVTTFAAEKLDVDAAIIFSDILLIVEPLGFQLSFEKNHGPRIGNPYHHLAQLKNVSPDQAAHELSFVYDAVRLTRRSMRRDLPLIGFAGGPFTVATYLIEAGKSDGSEWTMKMIKSAPDVWHRLMTVLTAATGLYLRGQIEAGADAVQIFDTWVGRLTEAEYRDFVLPYVKAIVNGLPAGIPVVLFGRNAAHLFPLFAESGAGVIGVDQFVSLAQAWDILEGKAIQGNLDPEVLLKGEGEIRVAVKDILDEAGERPGHIFNLGHGVLPQTPVQNVQALVHFVKDMSRRRR